MNLRTKLMMLGVIILLCLLSTKPATAATITAREFQDLQVTGHHFTTAISTRTRTLFVKDPSKGRYIVLKLAGTLQKGGGKIFTNDFTLRYFHSGGKEDRNECSAIATAKTAEIGELSNFATGNGSWISLDSGKIYFSLVFFIEKDVDTIDIHRLGVAEPFTYRVGTERLYSIAIFTNKDSNTLSEAVEVIKAGGYQVVTSSETLAKEETGTTILYMEQAESQAREISQRLMTKLGVVPTVKKMDVISNNDIVVWLGK